MTNLLPSAQLNERPGGASRDMRVDALKGFAIALVIATHVLNLRLEFLNVAPWLVAGIVAFNMPLFAFLSGYVLSGREGHHPLRFIRKKAMALLIPYVAWIAIEAPLRKVAPVDIPLRLVQALIDPGKGMQMWFLLVLFWIFVVFTVVRLASTSTWWNAAVALLIGAMLWLPMQQSVLLTKIEWLYPFFILGYLAARHRDFLASSRGRMLCIAAAAVVLVAMPFSSGWLFKFEAALVGTALSWLLYGRLSERVLRPQAWVGARSLGIYGAQMVVLPYLMVGAGWAGALVSFVLVLAATCAMTWGIEKVPPLRWVLLGQWPKRWGKPATEPDSM